MVRVIRVLLALLALGSLARAAESFGELTVDDVAKRIKAKSILVFDCNPAEEYAEGHLPTAKHVDFSNVTAGDLPADKNAALVFYCENEH
jgi:rhodanese-related sulfurtransferase